MGLVRVENAAGKWVSRACECQEMQREERRLAAAHIPCLLYTSVPALVGAVEDAG